MLHIEYLIPSANANREAGLISYIAAFWFCQALLATNTGSGSSRQSAW
jgi:hypothetical protein